MNNDGYTHMLWARNAETDWWDWEPEYRDTQRPWVEHLLGVDAWTAKDRDAQIKAKVSIKRGKVTIQFDEKVMFLDQWQYQLRPL